MGGVGFGPSIRLKTTKDTILLGILSPARAGVRRELDGEVLQCRLNVHNRKDIRKLGILIVDGIVIRGWHLVWMKIRRNV